MMIIGCDFHPRFQQIAHVDQETGECGELRLGHPEAAAVYYRSLCGSAVRIGMEATGNCRWFRRLMSELGHEVALGNASAIRASCPRRQKADKRDARHILTLLIEDRFQAVWQPPVESEEQRQLLQHRSKLVRLRTQIKNQLDALAKDEGLLSCRVWPPRRREQIASLPMGVWMERRRKDLLDLLDELERRIKPLDEPVSQAAEQNQEARLPMTHPGVGPVVSLAYVLTIGDWKRFPRGKYVASYLGLIPAEASSSDKRRLGHISKQGNPHLRWLLVQAALTAQRYDANWHRQYVRLSIAKHHGVAKLAIAHKLAVRLYWMLRSGQDYRQVVERSSHVGQSAQSRGSVQADPMVGRPASSR
jgi:transposase